MDPESFSSNWVEVFYPWEGGFSILGTIIAVVMFLPIYLWLNGVKILEFMDLVAIYAPLMQAISRIGCFLAGCCYGIETLSSNPIAVRYRNPECLAPIGVYLHPAQLYSAGASLIVFLLMRYFFSYRLKKAGQLTFTYLCLESIARFAADFWRAEWQAKFNLLGFINRSAFISHWQIVCIALFAFSITGLIWASRKRK
jgi:phosphatidylglycerol:prolipoprotein diacylglycerol transferase